MAAKKKVKQKKYHKGSARHKGMDDLMVTAVLIVAGISILILLASYISVTGKAVAGTPDTKGVTTLLQNAEIISGEGKMKCSYACARKGKNILLSYLDGELVGNNDIIEGKYSCLCASTG